MNQNQILTPAPPDFNWPRCPETDQFIRKSLQTFLKGHTFANQLAHRMKEETSTELLVWVDHLILPKKNAAESDLKNKYGLLRDLNSKAPAGTIVYRHPFADLPAVLLSESARALSCAIRVDQIDAFQKAHNLSNPIEGTPLSTYRQMKCSGEKGDLFVIERRGTRNFIPDSTPMADAYANGLKKWAGRPRKFENDADGMKETLTLAQNLAKELGSGVAATLFLEAERQYWQSRNHAGQIQKDRQDALGLGWANHDHHTFRSSRATFTMLIALLMAFGFKKRERFYAGAEAGWGAQVMENSEAGHVIFADVDLKPDDATIDFSSEPLPKSSTLGTIGLWCALHGESMLEAGMHHLEAQFDFDHLKNALGDRQIETMAPFSDFSHLRQAFTKGEQWTVSPQRLEALKQKDQLSIKAYQQIKEKGAVGSHLENLQRRDGFKGFNQESVNVIITEVNPEKQAGDQTHDKK